MSKKPKQVKSILLRLIALAKPYTLRFIAAGFCLLMGSLVALCYPMLARYAIDQGLEKGDMSALDGMMPWLATIFALHAVFVWFRHYLMSWLGVRAVSDLRATVVERIVHLPISWFHDRRSGELVGRLSADVAIIEEVIGSQLSMALRNVVQLIGGIVLLLVVDWKLTLVMLAIVPPFSVSAVYFGGKLRKRSKIVQDRLGEASGRVQESIAAIDTVQAFRREGQEAAAYRKDVDTAFRSSVKLIQWRSSFMASTSVITYAALALILILGAQRLSAGQLGAFLMYTGMVAAAFATIAGLYGALSKAAGATERLYDIIDTIPDIRDPESPTKLPAGRGELQFKNVSFHYASRPDDPILQNISLSISPGQVVALVGPSGSGKTTIASLIPRFYDVNSGQITLEGVDIRQLELEELRGSMAIVSQEPILFSGSIRDNIAYANPSLSEAAVIKAAQDAYADDFIRSFPDGYATQVGERGVQLSGGQKQRIAIARALIANPRILILDEATSNLDSESEAAVQKALAVLMRGRTTLVVAHRLSTIRDADKICVVENGEISDSGTHIELMLQSATYQKLVEHQYIETSNEDSEPRDMAAN